MDRIDITIRDGFERLTLLKKDVFLSRQGIGPRNTHYYVCFVLPGNNPNDGYREEQIPEDEYNRLYSELHNIVD
jgi:hypothetical protein